MKNYLILILFFLKTLNARAQQDSTLSLDQLQTPSSPAFNMLGIDPENIERPKNPTDFAVSLNNATQNFTSIPKSFAVEFSPYWIFGGRNSSFQDFVSNKVGNNILQTFIISSGTTTKISAIDSSEFNQVALAMKFSILRGKVTKEFTEWNDSAYFYLTKHATDIGNVISDLIQSDSIYVNLSSMAQASLAANDTSYNQLNKLLNVRFEQLREKADIRIQTSSKTTIDRLNTLAGKTDFKRSGWKLDAAIGIVMDYPNNTFQTCYVTKLGAWLTGGYESEKKLNALGVFRLTNNFYRTYLNDSNQIINDIKMGSFDWGVRVYKDFKSKLTLSFEHITRIPIGSKQKLNDNHIEHPKVCSRNVFSINYKVGKNQNLTFTYGKDFDDSQIKKGNLVIALGLVLGFGSERPFGGNSR